ncbi:MAG: TolC family protein [Acidobacteriota bacterium]
MFVFPKIISKCRSISPFVAGLFLAAVFCSAAQAQSPTPTPVPAPTPNDAMPVAPTFNTPPSPMPSTERVGVDNSDQLPLTIEQAVEMALKNNNNIEASRKDVHITDFDLKGARGVYDPLINSQGYYESRTTPTASTIGGAVNGAVTQRQFFGTGDISGFSPVGGGSYDFSFNSARVFSTNRNSTLNPQFPTSLVATFTQPLLRGLRFDNNRRTIEIAKKNIDLSDSQLRQQAITVVNGVEQAYWDLTFALRNLQVQTDTLKQAKDQLESNQRLVSKGVLAPIEIVAANAQISTYEQGIFLAQEAVTRAENTLKTLLLPNRSSPEWRRPITPVSPITQDVPQIGLAVALTEAMKNRPELTQLEVNSQINKINLRYYRDQTRPQLDLVGSYTAAGLAGTRNPLSSGSANVPANLVGGYVNSLGNLLQQDFPTYRIGVNVSLPWGNHVAKANLGRTLVEGDRLKNLESQQEETIEAEVRNATQALRSAEARLTSATAARVAAEELYSSEERQFRAGTTTFYLVAQRQTDLLAARGREIQGRTDLNKAISEFNRSIGKTLDVNNVTVTK